MKTVHLGGLTVNITGDPHIGREFKNGVPLDQRGIREAGMLTQLRDELMASCDVHVMTGDLFDHANVSYEVLHKVYEIYLEAAATNSDIQYVLLAGNHDLTKDVHDRSAFDTLDQIFINSTNVHCVVEIPFVYKSLAFVPWHAVTSAKSMVSKLHGEAYDAVFTHMDFEAYGGDEHNLMPYEDLVKITSKVFNGHIHKPRSFNHKGMEVCGVGSMQPYAHGEETDETLYLTRLLADLEPTLDYSGKHLRVLLAPGEEVPPGLKYRQLTTKIVTGDSTEDEEMPEVEIESFDMKRLFNQIMDSHKVSEDLKKTLWEQYLQTQS